MSDYDYDEDKKKKVRSSTLFWNRQRNRPRVLWLMLGAVVLVLLLVGTVNKEARIKTVAIAKETIEKTKSKLHRDKSQTVDVTAAQKQLDQKLLTLRELVDRLEKQVQSQASDWEKRRAEILGKVHETVSHMAPDIPDMKRGTIQQFNYQPPPQPPQQPQPPQPPQPPPIDDSPLPDPKAENDRRRQKVKEGFQHAWGGYVKHAWGYDELQPLSRKGKNWSKPGQPGFGMTIVDALSTLWLTGLHDEFRRGCEWVRDNLEIERDADMSAFETTIRMVGGLLSAYELSGEQHKYLLDKARQIADALLYAYNTTTGIPHATVNFRTKVHSNPKWLGGSSVLSEFGSVQLEFKTLSYHTGNGIYDKKATHIMNVIERHLPANGMAPVYLNLESSKWTTDHITLGALGDSYFEYLLKQYLLTEKEEPRYRDLFTTAANGIIDTLVKVSSTGQTYVGQFKKGSYIHKMDHLACFVGGMYALGAQKIENNPHKEEWMHLAAEVTSTCHHMYAFSRTGLAPEVAEFRGGGDMTAGPPYYILRPETVESYFYMWRFTKDQKYRDWGWEMFLAAERWCKVDSGGYSGLKNVNQNPAVKDDLMQSFWLAETMKYLFLLFSDDDVLDFDHWVLNTEAHPLKIRREKYHKEYYNSPVAPSEVNGYVMNAHPSHAPVQQNIIPREPVPAGYRMVNGMDVPDKDLHKEGVPNPVSSTSIKVMAEKCDAIPECKAFNSNGYLKTDGVSLQQERHCNTYIKM